MYKRGCLSLCGYAALAFFSVAAIGVPTSTAMAQSTENCTITAKNAAKACRSDVQDDYLLTQANCQNLATFVERGDCRAEADLVFEEETAGCTDQRDARFEVCDLFGQDRYAPDPLLDPNINFVNPDEIPTVWPANSFFSLVVGKTYVARAGEDFEETDVVYVSNEIQEVNGIACRVVVDISVVAEPDGLGGVDYVPDEATDDLYAQSDTGDVYYCGEISRSFANGILAELDGSFLSGVEFAKAGRLIRAAPAVDDADRQEFALGEAEDIVEYVDLAGVPGAAEGGENPAFPCAPNGCLQTLEYSPLEPGITEFKYYIPDTGFVLAVEMEDGVAIDIGGREERLCSGDSLDILNDAACGIEDPAALLDTLCKLSPDAFCP